MSASPQPIQEPASRPGYKWELLALLFFAFFFHQGDRAVYGVVLSAIKDDLHLADSQLGAVGSVLFFVMALMMPIAGVAGDVWNRKKIIVGSLLFWSIATMCTGFATGLMGLIMFRSIATAGGEAFYSPAAYPLMAAHHVRTRSLAFSIHQSALYIGVITTGFLGGYIAEKLGWRSAFYLYGCGGIVLGLVLAWRLIDAPALTRLADATSLSSLWETLGMVFRTPSAALLTLGFIAIVFVNNAYVVWAPIFLQEKFKLTLTQAGTYAMFYHHVAAFAGILAGGWVSDRMAAKHMLFRPQLMGTVMLLGVPVIVFMGQAGSLAAVCAAMAGFGLLRGLYEANTHAALFEVIAPKYRASAIGVTVMVAFLIGSASPWVLGKMRESFAGGTGLSYGFSSLAGAYLLGGLAVMTAVLKTFKRDRRTEDQAPNPSATH